MKILGIEFFDRNKESERRGMTLAEYDRFFDTVRKIQADPEIALDEEEKDLIEKKDSEFDGKVIAWAAIIKEFQNGADLQDKMIEFHKERIEELQEKKKSMQGVASRMGEFLMRCMIKNNKKKITSQAYTATVCAKPASVRQVKEGILESLGDEYKRVKVEIDKTAIKKALQSGKEVEGFELVTDDHYIKIK